VSISDSKTIFIPSPQVNPEEEEKRAQAAKQERLQNAELLHVQQAQDISSET
jgi:vacuolar protein sorting-associated protein 13A/C